MIAFSFFGISVYWYGIFYALTFFFAYLFFLFLKKWKFLSSVMPKAFGFFSQHSDDILLFSILGLLIGGRLGHVFIYDFDYYLQFPFRVFAVWEGGMSFIGGMIGVVFSLFLLFRKYTFSFKDILFFSDILIFPVGIGIMLGRIGNFLNQELYGRLVRDVFPSLSQTVIDFLSRLSLVHVYDHVDSFLRINTNFLSSFFEGFFVVVVSSFFLFSAYKKKKRNVGFLSSFFLLWYSFVRFLFEYLRVDAQSEYFGFFTRSQRFFLLFFLLGCYLFFRRKGYYMK